MEVSETQPERTQGVDDALVGRRAVRRLFKIIKVIVSLFLYWELWLVLVNTYHLIRPPAFIGRPSLAAYFIDLFTLIALFALYQMRLNPQEIITKPPGMSWFRRRALWGSFLFFFVLGRIFVEMAVPFLGFHASWYAKALMAFIFIPFVQTIAGAATALGLWIGGSLVLAILIGVPLAVYKLLMTAKKTMAEYGLAKGGLIGSLVMFCYWLLERPLPEFPPDDTKGARMATNQEIQVAACPGGIAFGHHHNKPLHLPTEKHVLVMASTRSGKGVSLIIPHLLRYHGSAFVLDPKGENAKATGRQRSGLNSKVHYLDPFGISGKPQSRFNPLSRFTLKNMEAESKSLAAAMVMGQQGGTARDHWTASAQQLLASVILHVFTSPDIPKSQKDLVTVRRLLLKDLNSVFRSMLDSTVADGLLSALAASFVQTPEKELGSIISTTQRETEILDNPFIAACLAASGEGGEVDFSEWKTETMTVYLCLSAPKFPVFNRWLRLVLTSALDEMTDTLNPPALPVCFMLDELATLGHLTTVENAIGLAAGYGVQLFTVFQDVAQMKDLYRGRWASFIGNAGVRALFNLDDYETAKYWSDFLGARLVQTSSQQQDIYGFIKGENVGEALRPLMSPEEIMMRFSREKMLVLPSGTRPIITDRVPYYEDRSLTSLWDDPRMI